MTEAEAQAKIKEHLLKQGKKAIQNGECRLKTKDGLKCAVGCLIPDEEYKPELECCMIGALKERCRSLNGLSVEFLRHMQQIHDHVDPEYWKDAL